VPTVLGIIRPPGTNNDMLPESDETRGVTSVDTGTVPVSQDTGTVPVSTVPGRALFSAAQAPRLAIQGFVASRLILLLVALIMVWLNGWSLADPLSRWDASHFMGISRDGYTTLTEAAYFPGVPMLMAALHLIGLPAVISGMLISLAGSALAAWALYRLAGGSLRGTIAVLAWSFAPMAVFTFVPYTEAAFCAAAFWAFWFAKRDRWGTAAALAAFACTTRVSGLFLIGALGLVALVGIGGSPWRDRLRRVAWLGMPVAVLAAYAVFLRLRFGSWTIWFQAQVEGWGRRFDWPWNALATTLRVAGITEPSDTGWAAMFRWELAVWLVGLAVAVFLLVRRKWPEGAWIGVQVVVMSCQVWLISVTRALLLWFPVFTLIGAFAARGPAGVPVLVRRAGFLLFFVMEAAAMVWWAVLFFAGAWAT